MQNRLGKKRRPKVNYEKVTEEMVEEAYDEARRARTNATLTHRRYAADMNSLDWKKAMLAHEAVTEAEVDCLRADRAVVFATYCLRNGL